MGHTEMLLAVAGLSSDGVKEQARKLADSDFSAFPRAERQAFRFACKLTREPGAVTGKDVAALEKTFGRHRAVDLIYFVAWTNYMTRIADAFQLPLETENVFVTPK